VLAPNGWSCSRKLCRTSPERPSFAMLLAALASASSRPFNRQHHHYAWSCSRSIQAKPAKASARPPALLDLQIAAWFGRPSAGVSIYRSAIIKLSAQYKLPAVYGFRLNAVDGGLIAYGPNRVDQFRRVGEYTDRILKGEKPADLPVQAPAKYELVVNLKTA